ncbi:hypothetical protein MAIT1_00219 [Magnetofaba australis IT-1]|uniref:Uncharacterized protein n=2 Tax=Magnetofaba TaxID=1472292 RepID=A0A1Y2K827_9PROT|nr:hypothetical protein MAIT1_00219 [Magnetofaba australis IT-1]
MLTAQFREDLSTEVPGAELVIRSFENSHGVRQKEYWMRGNLFQIHVEPPLEPPYELLDQDGDGQFETRLTGGAARFVVPQWALRHQGASETGEHP